jgi:exonuclease SbcD
MQSDVREKLKAGLIQHYGTLFQSAKGYREAGVPLIATGHLTLSGTASGEGEREIHLGAGGLVSGQDLGASQPEKPGFDYIALGHIHRGQALGDSEHVRYSGSPVPLSFSEADDIKEVVLLETRRANPHTGTPLSVRVQSIAVPTWRRLVRWTGPLEDVCAAIQQFQPTPPPALEAWADIRIESDQPSQIIDAKVAEALAGKPLRVLRMRKVETLAPKAQPSFAEMRADLHELNPTDVFTQKCDEEGYVLESEKGERLRATFAELLEMHGHSVASK